MRRVSVFVLVAGYLLISCGGGVYTGTPTGAKVEFNPETGQYEVVDELCFGVDQPRYTKFFEGPLFRGIDQFGKNKLALVDGANLWVVDGDDPDPFIHPRSVYPWAGHTLDIRVASGFAYVAAAEKGLRVFDLSTESEVRLVRSIETPDYALSVARQENLLFVAAARAGLLVFDLSQAGNPRLVASLDTPGLAADVAVDGRMAYVADCTGLVVAEVGEDGEARMLGKWSAPTGAVKGVAVSDGVAVLAGDGHGTYFVSVSDPARPVLRGTFDIPENKAFFVNAVEAKGRTAYLASGDIALTTLNFTDPRDPWLLESTPIDPIEVRMLGRHLYSLGNFRRADERVVEVMEPSFSGIPQPVRSYRQAKPYVTGLLHAEELYIRRDGRVYSVDVSKPVAPTVRWSSENVPFPSVGSLSDQPTYPVLNHGPAPDGTSEKDRKDVIRRGVIEFIERKTGLRSSEFAAISTVTLSTYARWLGAVLLVGPLPPEGRFYTLDPAALKSLPDPKELKPGESPQLVPLALDGFLPERLKIVGGLMAGEKTQFNYRTGKDGASSVDSITVTVQVYRLGSPFPIERLVGESAGPCDIGRFRIISYVDGGLGYECIRGTLVDCRRFDVQAGKFLPVDRLNGSSCEKALDPAAGIVVRSERSNSAYVTWLDIRNRTTGEDFAIAFSGSTAWEGSDGRHWFRVDDQEVLRVYDIANPLSVSLTGKFSQWGVAP